MGFYQQLVSRLEAGDVLILDGAVGTELQTLGVPIAIDAWSASALQTHPDTVRFMHEQYIRCGVDIITTNTFSSARHCLETADLGELTRELNLRAVVLAQEARARTANGRSVCIAGSVSSYGIRRGQQLEKPYADAWADRSEDEYQNNLHEQAKLLAESGVDFLLAECTGGTKERIWVVEACKAADVPVWIGFKAHRTAEGELDTGYASGERLVDDLDAVVPMGGDVMSVFHTGVNDTDECLALLRERWSGSVAVYPDAEREDYVDRQSDGTPNAITPDEFAQHAQRWIAQGAQVVGGCCGFGIDYISALCAALRR